MTPRADHRGAVSVIIPAYNCRPYIVEAVQSVLAQGSCVREVIVVDDGSTDGTPDALRGLDARVRLIEQKNAGPAAARNRALREASGEYLAFNDGDDIWLPGKLDTELAYLDDHPEVGLVFGRISYWPVDEQGGYPDLSAQERNPGPEHPPTDERVSGFIYPELLLDSEVCIITVLMRRRVYEMVGGFDESLRTGEDYDFWLRAARHFEMHKLARYMARYRLHPQCTTRRPRAECNELTVLLRALQRFGKAGPDGRAVDELKLRRRIAMLWFGHGYLHFWRGSMRVAADAFGHALGYERHLKWYLYRLLSTSLSVMPPRALGLWRSGGRS